MNKKRIVTPVVMLVGIALCTAARIFTISQTDMKLGSINHGYEVVCNALYYGAILVSAVLAAVFAPSPKRNPDEDEAKVFPQLIISGGGAVAVGFGLLAVGVGTAYDAVLTVNNGLIFMIFKMAGFVFAALFIICAFVALYKKKITPGLGFACAVGSVSFVLRGVFSFMNRMVVSDIPEYLIEVLCSVFGGIFFVTAGQVFTGNEGKRTRKRLCAWGTGTAALTLSALLGTAAAKLFLDSGISERIVLTSVEADRYFQMVQGVDGYRLAFPAFANIGLGICAAIVVFVVCRGAEDNPPETTILPEQSSQPSE